MRSPLAMIRWSTGSLAAWHVFALADWLDGQPKCSNTSRGQMFRTVNKYATHMRDMAVQQDK
eukprot:5010379-Pleurochrysis_carterae.AAC.2